MGIFFGLTIIFGFVWGVDTIEKSSHRYKKQVELAKKKSKQEIDIIMKETKDYADKQIELWKQTDLPPYKWK